MSCLRCPEHDDGLPMDVRVLAACQGCSERYEEWYRVAEETSSQIARYRRG